MYAPKGKHIFGTVKVGEKGQIVIPKDAREIFGIQPGDSLVVLGDEATGLAMIKNDVFLAQVSSAIFQKKAEPDPERPAGESDEEIFDEIKGRVEKRAKE